MANIPYQASSIIAGVSTRPYALRRDGHAIDQENCMLSPQYGLVKRPGTTFHQVIEGGSGYVDDGVFIHPLNHDGKERILVISSTKSVQVFDKEGKKYPVTHFPSTDDRTKSCWLKYSQLMTDPAPGTSTAAGGPLKNLDPRRMSATTLGDVTWICADNVATEQGSYFSQDYLGHTDSDIWEGFYHNRSNDPSSSQGTGDGDGGLPNPFNQSQRALTTNDDVFTIWVRSIVPTTNPRDHKITVTGSHLATDTVPDIETMSIETQMGEDGDENTLLLDVKLDTTDGTDNQYAKPSATNVAAHFSYLLSDAEWDGYKSLEATSLDTQTYATPSGGINQDGLESIMCKWTDTQYGGYLASVSLGGSGADSTAGTAAGDSWATVCWKEVPAISDLPPNSFNNHTVKVGSTDIDGGFYARFVSDDTQIKSFSNNVDYGNNTMVTWNDYHYPRKGHWEEYCAVGTNRRIKSRSMPPLLVHRPDDTYAIMEARGEFQINASSTYTQFFSGNYSTAAFQNAVRINAIDAGFSHHRVFQAPANTTGESTTNTPATNDDDVRALVVGDTIEFRDITNLPIELKTDKTYYVVQQKNYNAAGTAWGDSSETPGNVTARQYIWISETKDGPIIEYSQPTTTWSRYPKIFLTTYAAFDWSLRECGDDDTNPMPGFMGRPIKSVFNFQDRIGFLSEGQISFSGTGDYFNLFRTTVRDLVPSDAFTIAPSTEFGEILQHAVPFDRELIAVSNRAQFVVSGDGGFSPHTASITKVSQTPSSFRCRPSVIGDSLFLAYDQEGATGIHSIRQSSTVAGKFDTFDTTTDVPGYIPQGPVLIVGSEKHKMLFLLCNGRDEPQIGEPAAPYQNLYVYSWDMQGNELIHSAWTTWKFGGKISNAQSDYRIKNMLVQGDRLYLVVSTPVNGPPVTVWEDALEYIDLDVTSKGKTAQRIQDDFGKPCLDRLSVGGSNYLGSTDQSGGQHDQGLHSVTLLSNGNTNIKLKWPLTEETKQFVTIVRDNGMILDSSTTGDGELVITLAQADATIGQGDPEGLLIPRVTVQNMNLLNGQNFYIGLNYDMKSRYGPFVPTLQDQSMGGRNIFARAGRLTYSKAHQFDLNVHQDKLYTQSISAVPSDFVANLMSDPEDITGLSGARWNNAHDSSKFKAMRNYTLSPTGTLTADYSEVLSDPSLAEGYNANVTQDVWITPTLNQNYTGSIYIKKSQTVDNVVQMVVYLVGNGVKEKINVRVDTYAGTITVFGSGQGSTEESLTAYTEDKVTLTDVSDEWLRLSASIYDSTGVCDRFRMRIYPRPEAADRFVVLWGAQLVPQDTAAPYYSPVPLIKGDTRFTLRKNLPDLNFEIVNSSPWNAMFQVLHYDLAVQDIV